MKKAWITMGIIAVMVITGLIGYSIGDSDDASLRLQIAALQAELKDCENTGHWQSIGEWVTEYEREKALYELAQSLAELQSANITIDTPNASIHVEWQR